MSDTVLPWKQWQLEVQRLLDLDFGAQAGRIAALDIDWISWQHEHARGRTPLQAIEHARTFIHKLDRIRHRQALRHGDPQSGPRADSAVARATKESAVAQTRRSLGAAIASVFVSGAFVRVRR